MVDTPRAGAWCYTVNDPKPRAACSVTVPEDPILVERYIRLTPTQARMRCKELVDGGSVIATIRQNGESVAFLSKTHGWTYRGRWVDPLYAARRDDPCEPLRLPISVAMPKPSER